MKSSWPDDSDHLECRWSDDNAGDDAFPYEAPWAHDDSLIAPEGPKPEAPNFASSSPFRHQEWRRGQRDTQI